MRFDSSRGREDTPAAPARSSAPYAGRGRGSTVSRYQREGLKVSRRFGGPEGEGSTPSTLTTAAPGISPVQHASRDDRQPGRGDVLPGCGHAREVDRKDARPTRGRDLVQLQARTRADGEPAGGRRCFEDSWSRGSGLGFETSTILENGGFSPGSPRSAPEVFMAACRAASARGRVQIPAGAPTRTVDRSV